MIPILLVTFNVLWGGLAIYYFPYENNFQLLVAYGFVGSLLSSLAVHFYDDDTLKDSHRAGLAYLIGIILWFPITIGLYAYTTTRVLTKPKRP